MLEWRGSSISHATSRPSPHGPVICLHSWLARAFRAVRPCIPILQGSADRRFQARSTDASASNGPGDPCIASLGRFRTGARIGATGATATCQQAAPDRCSRRNRDWSAPTGAKTTGCNPIGGAVAIRPQGRTNPLSPSTFPATSPDQAKGSKDACMDTVSMFGKPRRHIDAIARKTRVAAEHLRVLQASTWVLSRRAGAGSWWPAGSAGDRPYKPS